MTAIQDEATDEATVIAEPLSLKQIIEMVHTTGEPMLVTIEGKPQFVALSLEAYRAMEAKADHWETLKAIKEAEADYDRGDYCPAREALEELGRKHGILR